MDIHRCRFVPFQPSAVNSIAFSQPKTRIPKQQRPAARLAVGRANGDIDIWNPNNGSWHQERIIRGGKDRSVDGLVWVNDPDRDAGDGNTVFGKSRLFSVGYTSTITEWDLVRGRPKRHASGQHGDIWCIAAQPSAASSGKERQNGHVQGSQAATKLIVGTIDGELVMYSVEEDDLSFQRVLFRSPTRKSQMVSITFQSRRVVLVGCSDSTIRAIDIQAGRLIKQMTLGADPAGGSKDVIVWSVKCLPNGNIVSGDSTGQICIWDGKTYTQSQRIQSHKQDVLSLATSEDGSAIVSGGMDRRTVIYKQNQGEGGRWSKVSGRRYHEHDVKAMASFEQDRMSVVVSGGPDSNLVVIPLKKTSREFHRTISSLPQEPSVISAPGSRFLVSWWDREIHIWSLKRNVSELLDIHPDDININQNRKLLKTIVVKGDANISSVTMDRDGSLLFVATSTDIKAFRLRHELPEAPSQVAVSTLELPDRLATHGATRIKISPDERWLCLVQEGSKVVVVNIENGKAVKPSFSIQKLSRLRRKTSRNTSSSGLASYDRHITHITFSPDSKVLAVADLAGYIDTWVISSDGKASKGETAEDSAASSYESLSSEDDEASHNGSRGTWIQNRRGKLLAKIPGSPVVLSFSDLVPDQQGDNSPRVNDYVLLVVTSSWQVLAFHPLEGSFTAWSRQHPKSSLPAAIRGLLDTAKGVIWEGSRAWIYGVSFLSMIDTAQDLRESASELALAQEAVGKKRKRDGPSSGAGGRMNQGNLVPHSAHRHAAGEVNEMELDDPPEGEDGESENEADDTAAGGELLSIRKRTGTSGAFEPLQGGGERRKWWITHKYRPIFGIVPLSTAGEALEVALIERPSWEMDMPERVLAKD